MNGHNKSDSETLVGTDSQQTYLEHLASLRYAGMIQNALMPSAEYSASVLKEYFVLLLPRDIVSGDFHYLFANRDYVFIAAGDCTGHGVPGALMSILGISILNEILQSGFCHKPNRVLNLMREKVMKALNQTGDKATTKDSIDLALCMLNRNTGIIEYAGANRPLIRIRDGELSEFKPDFMTIGLDPVREKAFTNISIETRPGDIFYLFSDGFPDQFGGPVGKKLKLREFKRLLEQTSQYPFGEQLDFLRNAFIAWKGPMEQVDDVLVFGFRL